MGRVVEEEEGEGSRDSGGDAVARGVLVQTKSWAAAETGCFLCGRLFVAPRWKRSEVRKSGPRDRIRAALVWPLQPPHYVRCPAECSRAAVV